MIYLWNCTKFFLTPNLIIFYFWFISYVHNSWQKYLFFVFFFKTSSGKKVKQNRPLHGGMCTGQFSKQKSYLLFIFLNSLEKYINSRKKCHSCDFYQRKWHTIIHQGRRMKFKLNSNQVCFYYFISALAFLCRVCPFWPLGISLLSMTVSFPR